MAEINDCDIEKTYDLIDLFETPREERDEAWVEDFFETVANASLVSLEPQIQRGPDGFPYFVLSLPKPNEDFDAFSVAHAIPYCLKHGCGIVLFKSPDDLKQPEWVFPFGSLWAYDRFGNFVGDPTDERPEQPPAADAKNPESLISEDTAPEGREVMVSAPADDFLPTYARKALGRFLKDAVGIKEPHVALITDPNNKPSRSLMFTDLLPERFEKEEHFVQLMTAIRWFLPPSRGLMVAVPQLSEYSNPL